MDPPNTVRSQGEIIPMRYKNIAGMRPVISYQINGKKATSVIHSNAMLYLNLNHKNAEYFGVENLREVSDFGISEPGKVDKSYIGTLKEMRFGSVVKNNTEISVFETYPADKKGFGMLGLDWIVENSVIMDFLNDVAIVGPEQRQQDSAGNILKANGYIMIPLQHKDDGFYVDVEVNGIVTPFRVSTVSSMTVDSVYAQRTGIHVGKKTGTYGGPSGAVGYVYKFNDIALRIGDLPITATKGIIMDTYAYEGETRPDKKDDYCGGWLGAEFLKEQRAVIDFGRSILYIK